jgi:translation initiation factor IF-3
MQINSSRKSYASKKPYNSASGFQLGQSGTSAAPNKYGSQLGQGPKPTVSSSSFHGSSSTPKPFTGTASRPYSGASTGGGYKPRVAGGTTGGYRPAYSGTSSSTGGTSGGYRPGGYRPGGYTPGGSGGYRPAGSGGASGGYNGSGRSFDDRRDFKRKDNGPNRNYWIRAPKVLVIDDEGNNLGEMETEKALLIAKEREQDLVEVSPNANPPVCRIIDYAKFMYEQKKKAKTAKATGTKEMKELKFSPVIDEHDISVRIKRAFEFMGKGHNVRLTIEKKGRQSMDQVNTIMAKLLTYFEGYSTIEAEPKTEGKRTYITFKNDGKAKNKKNISEKS